MANGRARALVLTEPGGRILPETFHRNARGPPTPFPFGHRCTVGVLLELTGVTS